MTNGSGITNGTAQPSKPVGNGRIRLPGRAEQLARRRRNAVVLFVLFMVILATLLVDLAGLLGPLSDGIAIDGDFEDWEGRTEYLDPRGDAVGDGAVDLVSWRVDRRDGRLSVLAELSDGFKLSKLDGQEGELALRAFLDGDGVASTGYRVGGIGADTMLEVVAGRGGAIAAGQLRWEPGHRSAGNAQRDRDDWNGWAPTGMTVEVAARADRVELASTIDGPMGAGSTVLIHVIDAWGGSDASDVPVDGDRPSLLVLQLPLGVEVVPSSPVAVLQLRFHAFGGDVTVTGIAPVPSGLVLGRLDGVPTTVPDGGWRAMQLEAHADASRAGGLVSIGLARDRPVFVGDALVSVTGRGFSAYAVRPPDGILIDGAFGDWVAEGVASAADGSNDLVLPPGVRSVPGPPDLAAVAAHVGSSNLSLLASVRDGMLAGLSVPVLPVSRPEGALDRDGDGRMDLDGDGTEDGYGTGDDDWDNDAGAPDDPTTTFTDTGPDGKDQDDDNDGIPDWNDPARGGPLVPGPPPDLPPLLGRDMVEFLIDVDGDAGTGYSPEGMALGADLRVLVEGRDGEVRSAAMMSNEGDGPADWRWGARRDVGAAVNGTRLEVGVPSSALGAGGVATILCRAVGWTGSKDWSDGLLRGEMRPSGRLDVIATGAVLDPFATAANGTFGSSPDAATWSIKPGPVDVGAVVDVAAGDGTLRGYVFALTSKGKVMVTTGAVSGWTEYGQGTPSKPASSAYVALAAGRGLLAPYVYVLRADGAVLVCDRATNGWTAYGQGTPALPSSTAWVDIAAGAEGLGGTVYILRNDGAVYVSDSAVRGWTSFGQGTPALPTGSPDYVAIASAVGGARGTVHVLRRGGEVFACTASVGGWTRYAPGTPALPTTEGWVGMDAGAPAGRVMVSRADGECYVADSAVGGWARYGQGAPTLPSGAGYAACALGASALPGYAFLVSEDGRAYVSDSAVRGWTSYGQGTPAMPATGGPFAIASDASVQWTLSANGTVHRSGDGGSSWTTFGTVGGGDDGWVALAIGADGRLYALRRDGTVRRSATGSSSWTGHGDAGDGTSWASLAADNGSYLYGLRRDGAASYATTSSSTWSSKGDVGDGSAWVALAAFNGTGHVYALRADRTVARASAGTSSSWSTWASSGTDTSWVAAAADQTYLYVLRNDGRVDRAVIGTTPSWASPQGDVGADQAWTGVSVPVPEVPSILLQAAATVALALLARRRALASRATMAARCGPGGSLSQSFTSTGDEGGHPT